MKKTSLIALFTLLLATASLAQQDPNDPGLPDSLILGAVHVDSGATFAIIPIWAVTDDSVGFYNTPLTWVAPLGGVRGSTGTLYFPPLTSWDLRFDSLILAEDYWRMFGIYSLGIDTLIPPLLTNGQRQMIISLRFAISPGTPSQLVVIDTAFDNRNGSLQFGLVDGITGFTPRFQPGFISIGSVGAEDPVAPRGFSLSQNYPNPFNARTNIHYSLAEAGQVSFVVYNLLGQEVAVLIDETQEAGEFVVTWDGKNRQGVDAPTGIYLYRLATPNSSLVNKMVLIR